MGLDASRQEDIVIYQALYLADYDYFSRPLAEWKEQVQSLDGKGLVPSLSQDPELTAPSFCYSLGSPLSPSGVDCAFPWRT